MTSLFENLTPPPASELLGWELVSEDADKGEITVAFHPDHSMTNPRGQVQGGFVAAMLDDTMGPALLVGSGGRYIASTIDMSISYLRPVMPGRVVVKGQVVRMGRQVAFLEAELFDTTGKTLARATSSVLPVEIAPKTE